MSLFDFFFPEQAQASHLRRLAEQQDWSRRQARRNDARAERESEARDSRVTELEGRVQELERDLGFVALLLGSLLHTANKKGVVTRHEVASALESLDAGDGARDGMLDIEALRNWGQST